MNRSRPNQTFVILALVLIFTLVVGLVMVASLAKDNQPFLADDQTTTAILGTNHQLMTNVAQTTITPAAPNPSETYAAQQTAWAGTQTALAAGTYPYDKELYLQRQMMFLGLNTSGGPCDYAIFQATEVALIATYQGTALPTPTADILEDIDGPCGFYLQWGTEGAETAIARMTQTAVSSTTPTLRATASPTATHNAPYEPTQYAQRQATLASFATAAGPPTYVLFYAEETRIVSAYQGTPTATFPPSATPGTASGTSTPCPFMWARKDLPEITQLAQIALQYGYVSNFRNGIDSVRVEAYGESACASFMAMTTDFYLRLETDDLSDEAIAERMLHAYYALTDGLEIWWLPARFGYLDIRFVKGSDERPVRTMFSKIEAALKQGLTGAALLTAVSS